MATSGGIFDTVVAFFREEGWVFSQVEGELLLTLTFQGDHGAWMCVVQAREEAGQCVFYSVYPEKIPADRRGAVSEYLTRANYGLPSGNFEMDLNDGEVRFKTSIDVTGDRLSRALFSNLGSANVVNFDRYLPGIQAVAGGSRTPTAALADIEGSDR